MKKKLIGLATVSVIALSSQMASASEIVPAQVVDNNISSSYETASASMAEEIIYGLRWNAHPEGYRYQVGLFDITANKKIELRDPYTTERFYNFPMLSPYHDYRGWVGAYGKDGKLKGQGETNFSTKATQGDKTEVYQFKVEWK